MADTMPSAFSTRSRMSMPPVLSAPGYSSSMDDSYSTFTDSSSKRGRRTYNASEFVFSIDDDGRGALDQDDAAILEYFSQRYNQHATPTLPGTAAATAPYGFFHGNIYGHLRDSHDVTTNATLLAKHFAGYVLSALASGYVYVSVEYVLLRLDPRVLGLSSTRALSGLLDLQWAIVLLLGVLSDAFAPFGLRRNAYIIGGWIAVSVLWIVLFVLFQFSSELFASSVPPPAVATAGITAAMLALVVATNALDIRVIELSQQEELLVRGRLVATYQSLRIAAQVFLHVLMLTCGSSSTSSSSLRTAGSESSRSYLVLPFDVKFLLLHLALVALLPIPFLLYYAREERLKPETAAPHFAETCKQFWQCAQQKAIWQLVAFNCVLYFFTLLDYGDVTLAVAVWTRETPQGRRVRAVVADVAFVAALLAWKYCGVNACWRASIALVIISWSLTFLTGNALVVFDVARVPWFPTLMNVLRVGLRVLLLLSAFVPTIEVAQLGSEGTIFGLLSSFQSIAKVLGAQLASGIRDAGFAHSLVITSVDLQLSSRAVQWKVFWALLILVGAKLLALLALFFCPQQKLDAQQLRIYGGYSRLALLVFIGAYAVSFPAATYLQYRSVIK